MHLVEISKIRRFALTIAIVLAALVLADVKLETPVHITPLGVPLLIDRPDLLTLALVVAAIYSTIRYIYYGMLVQPSPMRARREMFSRTERRFVSGSDVMEEFRAQAQQDVERLFPKIGKATVTFDITQDVSGNHIVNMKVPRIVRLVCWLENVDYLLPILANVFAVGLWTVAWRNAS